jgi:hypothetical protein
MTRAERRSSADAYLFFLAMRLEQHMMEEGQYPEVLGDLGEDLSSGITYERHSPDRYTLRYRSDGMARSYSSGESLTALLDRVPLQSP